jgi:hypothetical protein
MQGEKEGDPSSSLKGRPTALATTIFLFPKAKPNNLTVHTSFECWRRRETKRKTKVTKAMEGEGV